MLPPVSGSLDPKQWSRIQFSNLHFWTPNFLPEIARIEFFEQILFSTISAVGEAQNPVRAAKLDAVYVFSHLLQILLKFQYGKNTNINFSQKFQM